MVNALVNLNENTNRILNIIKAENELKDKSEAIEFVVNNYIETENNPKLRPEYIKKALKIHREKTIHVGTPDDLRKMMGLK